MPKHKKKYKKKEKHKEELEPYVDLIWMHPDLWNNSGKTLEDIEREVYGTVDNPWGIENPAINYPKGHPKK